MKFLIKTGFVLILFIIINTIYISNVVFAIEEKHPKGHDQNYHYNFNVIDRLARIEEGQKAIIIEMQTRFEAMDKRFESVLREMNARFEAVDKRFDAVDKRFDAVDKRIDQLSTYFIAIIGSFVSIFLALIGFAIWDRKTLLVKAKEESEQLINNNMQQNSLNKNENQIKLQQVIDIMKKMSEKFPEMRSMMQTAQLL